MSIKKWFTWPWNWPIFKQTRIEDCTDVEQLMQLIEHTPTQKTIKYRPCLPAKDEWAAWLVLTIIWGTYAGFAVSARREHREKKRSHDFAGLELALLLFGSLSAVIAGVVLIPAIGFISALIGYAVCGLCLTPFVIGYEKYVHQLIEQDEAVAADQPPTIQSVLTDRIQTVRQDMIGENSKAAQEIIRTDKEISAAVSEKARYNEKLKAGSTTAQTVIDGLIETIARLEKHKAAVQKRIDGYRELFAAADARVEAQTSIIEEQEDIRATLAKFPDSQELRDRIEKLDAQLKQKLIDEFGTVVRALASIQDHADRAPIALSSEAIRQRVAMTAPADIAFEQAMDKVRFDLQMPEPEDPDKVFH